MRTSLRISGLFAIVLALFVSAFADTIRLKDGNVIRGQVIGFRDQQFTVLVGSGAQGRRSRTLVYVEDVESIEFDSATTAAAAGLANDDPQTSNNSGPTNQPPRPIQAPVDTSRVPPRQTPQSAPSTSPTFFTIKVGVNARQCSAPAVRGELCAPNGWTNTGLVVRQGQRLRISSTGRVSLGGGRFSTPAGMGGSPDNEKLMRTEATGALIAVIGDDNDDFLLIGTRRDFVSQRDGVLFLGLNEGNLADNTGTYDVVIEAEAGGSGPR
ncbi:MAG: LecA/PA-IL family lectin [Pyrinomonadaceae bacterium]